MDADLISALFCVRKMCKENHDCYKCPMNIESPDNLGTVCAVCSIPEDWLIEDINHD